MPSFYGRMTFNFTDTITEMFLAMEARIDAACLEAIAAAGEVVRESAYSKANVSAKPRGGGINGEHMRDEIKVAAFPTEFGVAATVGIDLSVIPYAEHQEFGIHGKPFLRPALDENIETCHEVIREHLAASLVEGTAVDYVFTASGPK